MCIVETWINNDILDSELCVQGYEIVRADRNRHGGGAVMYVNTCHSDNVLYPGCADLELLIVCITTTSTLITLALLYRPPSSPHSTFDDLLSTLFTYVRITQFSNFVLMGDFNVNFSDNTHPLFSKLLTVTSCLSLTQVVTSPTHCSNSLIDLVFLSLCKTLPLLANSDHNGIIFSLQNVKTKPNPIKAPKKIWRYNHADVNSAVNMIAEIDWDTILSSSDVDDCWMRWHTTFMRIMEACIPSATPRRRKNLPWLTKPVIQLMRRRNALFRAARKTKKETIQTKYKSVRNKLVALLRNNKADYFCNLGTCSQKDFRKAINLIRRQDCTIPALKDGSSFVTTNYDKAKLLNFFSAAASTAPSTPQQTLDPNSYPPHLLCTEEEVTYLLLCLDQAKYTGPDKISAVMLRSTTAFITPSLTKLFNLSIASGRFQTDWKCARITPIYKSGDSALASNYRPISILPIVSKLLERHIYTLLFDFLAANCPISPQQWGFMPSRSTTSALCTLIHDCHQSLDNESEICSVYFDFRKAFDTVPHSPLLNKLKVDKHLLT